MELAYELLFGEERYAVKVIAAIHWQIMTAGDDAYVLLSAHSLDLLPCESGMMSKRLDGEVLPQVPAKENCWTFWPFLAAGM